MRYFFLNNMVSLGTVVNYENCVELLTYIEQLRLVLYMARNDISSKLLSKISTKLNLQTKKLTKV